MRGGLALVLASMLAGCAERAPVFEAVSLLGDTLLAPAVDADVAARDDSLLAIAEAAHASAPTDVDSIIWLGRRLAYLGRYQDAIAAYTVGLEHYPDSPRLLRHRGHRYITVRLLGHAVQDLSRAAELIEGTPDRVEEDGRPNEAGIPVSSLHTNIWYHLGLAQYLRGAFEEARTAWERGLAAAGNPDMTVAFQYWLALSTRRMNDTTGTGRILDAVDPDAELLENRTYHSLLLHFRGDLSAHTLLPADTVATLENATAAYGVAAWRLVTGNARGAIPMFHRILAARDQWPAFGYIAAEAELARAGMAHEP